MNVTFEKLNINDQVAISEMSKLASAIVKEHFDPIIGAAQNDYMIAAFQSKGAIKQQLADGYQYYFVCNCGERIGYLAFEPRIADMYISKFYLQKDKRGCGISRVMLDFVAGQAKRLNLSTIVLRVNRHNDAIMAYEHLGFHRLRAETTEIGGGYVMDDFIYEYVLPEVEASMSTSNTAETGRG